MIGEVLGPLRQSPSSLKPSTCLGESPSSRGLSLPHFSTGCPQWTVHLLLLLHPVCIFMSGWCLAFLITHFPHCSWALPLRLLGRLACSPLVLFPDLSGRSGLWLFGVKTVFWVCVQSLSCLCNVSYSLLLFIYVFSFLDGKIVGGKGGGLSCTWRSSQVDMGLATCTAAFKDLCCTAV